MEEDLFLNYNLKQFKSFAIASKERTQFIRSFLSVCESNDLMYLAKKLDEVKKDFVLLLPLEIIEIILGFLDAKSLIKCCQVFFLNIFSK